MTKSSGSGLEDPQLPEPVLPEMELKSALTKPGDAESDIESLAEGSARSDSVASSEADSEEELLLKKQTVALATILVSGKSPNAKVHLLDPDDCAETNPQTLSCACGNKLHRGSAVQELAQHFQIFGKTACTRCKLNFPDQLYSLL